jgi:hypothetical protein
MYEKQLRLKLSDLSRSGHTLLWLEGASHNMIEKAELHSGNRLSLHLSNGTVRIISFERYAITKVGLQFWAQGRPGVLYRWEQVPSASNTSASSSEGGEAA